MSSTDSIETDTRESHPIRSGVRIGKVGSREIPPPLPTIDTSFREDPTVGERAGVRGPHRSLQAPHPGPLPTATSSPKVT